MIQVLIDGIDRTKQVAWESLRIENILTSQVDKCSFTIRNYGSKTYRPDMGNEVIIYDDSVKVFGGYLVRREQVSRTYAVLEFKCECVDYTRLLQKKLVTDTYENMAVEDIIDSIISKYLPGQGLTTTNVVAPNILQRVSFNYVPVQQCLEDLAKLIGYDWWVDYDKNIWFKAQNTVAAPFSLTDTNGNYIFNTLKVRKDNSQIKNTIVVRGGQYYADARRDFIKCNGVDFMFPLAYQYRNFSASLSGNPLDLGVDFSSDPDNHHALWNNEQKILRFKESDTPSATATISVEGEPLVPVILKVKDPAAIAGMQSAEGVPGDYEYLVVDKNLSSKQEARDRANAELIAYKETVEEGEFETEVAGLTAGQIIDINSDAYGIAESYLIRSVSAVMLTPTEFKYKIGLISTRTIDMIGVLQKLLLGRTQDIDITREEILDKVTSYFEDITISETHAESLSHHPQSDTMSAEEESFDRGLNYPVQFVLGDYTPTFTDWISWENFEDIAHGAAIVGTNNGKGWAGSWQNDGGTEANVWLANNASPLEGSISAKLIGTGGNKTKTIRRQINEISGQGTVYFDVLLSENAAGTTATFLLGSTVDNRCWILVTNGLVRIYSGSYTTVFSGLLANTKYRIGIYFDIATGKYKCNLDGSAWSAEYNMTSSGNIDRWKLYTTIQTAAAFIKIDNIGFDEKRQFLLDGSPLS